MNDFNKITRNYLLILADKKPDQIIKFTGHLKWNESSDWFTFSSIILIDSNEKFTSHINLPKHKINQILNGQNNRGMEFLKNANSICSQNGVIKKK